MDEIIYYEDGSYEEITYQVRTIRHYDKNGKLLSKLFNPPAHNEKYYEFNENMKIRKAIWQKNNLER